MEITGKTLMLRKIEGNIRSGQERMKWLNSIIDSTDMNLSELQDIMNEGKPRVLQSMGDKETGLSYAQQ